MASKITSSIIDLSSAFDTGVDKYTHFLKNNYISGILIILLVVYSSMIAPMLPYQTLKFFDSWIVKLIALFLIVYLSLHNATVALIASIAVLVSIFALNKAYSKENMANVVVGDDDPSGLMKGKNHQLVKNDAIDYANSLQMQYNNQTYSASIADNDTYKEYRERTMKVMPGKVVSLHEESLKGVLMDQYAIQPSKIEEMRVAVESILVNTNAPIDSVISSVANNNKSINSVIGYDDDTINGSP